MGGLADRMKSRNMRARMMRFVLAGFITVCLFGGPVSGAPAQEQRHGEYQVKAAFIYKFINFIEWPPESGFNDSPSINLCIIGDDPFGRAIDDMRSEIIKGKKPAIRRYASYEEARNCHIIFIPASEKYNAGHILKSARKSTALTVGDIEEFAGKGAIISFFIEESKVRFIINTEAARRSGLKISAKLLKLSKVTSSIEE
jgi:hypothetical protein